MVRLLSEVTRGVPVGRRSMTIALALAFVLALGVYMSRAAPTVLYGDSGEMQTVGLVGGVTHQTGYPAFVLTGYIFRHLGWPDHAYRITFVSNLFGAASVAMMLVLLVELGLSVMVAFAAALVFGGIYTIFLTALRAEVYTQSIFLSLFALWWTLRAFRSGRDRDVLLAGFLLGVSLTGHLMYALAVVVLGLALAWQVLATYRQRALPMLVALLGVFLLGLTPYLYLIWADAHHLPMNYLQLSDQYTNPLGLYNASFHDPWQRVWHFMMGTGPCSPHPIETHPKEILRNLWLAVRIVSLYQWGPVGVVLALIGFVRGVRHDGARARLLALLGLVSLGWAVAVGPSVILDLFLLPLLLYLNVFIAWGLTAVVEALGRRLGGGRAAYAALCLLVPVLTLIPAHGTRHWLDARQIRHVSLQIDYESYLTTPTFLPTLRDAREARRFGEQALAAMPHGTLVICGWNEFTTLRYFQLAEGQRRDLVLWPYSYPYGLTKIARWQQEHSLREQPVFFLVWYPMLAPYFTAVDSVRLAMGRTIYAARVPLKDLDRP
jgi:hypothetical protein